MDLYYSDGDFDDGDDPDLPDETAAEDDDDHGFLAENDDDGSDLKNLREKNYKIINGAEIRHRMKEDVAEVSAFLSISMAEASILLRNYDWSVTKVTEAWFADESGVREKVGLIIKPVELGGIKRFNRKFLTCGICFESIMSDDVKSTGCDHFYCKNCWSKYSSTSINNDGLRCLSLRCPEPSCMVAVSEEMIGVMAGFEDREKYLKCLVESYVEMNRRTKWCPGQNCDNAVEILEEDGSFDIVCDCFAGFCWNCNEEGHRPVDCETVKKWVLKNSSEWESQPFDFLIDGELVRMPLEKFLLAKGISAEKILEIEYIKAVVPRKEEEPSLHDDWVSAVDGSCPRFILTGCYDGFGRVWKSAGVCTHVLEGHSDAITSVSNINPEEIFLQNDQHSFSGHPNFEITCSQNNPILTISNDDYVIKDISYGNHSLLVANAATAGYQETCPTPAHNFSLDRSPFHISPGYTIFSLLYNCSKKPEESYSTYPISCATNDTHYSFAAFHIEALEYYNYSLGWCQSFVTAPHPGDGDIESLLAMSYTEVLRLGFILNWTANNCRTCERSGGRCGFENNEFICFCRDGPRPKSCPKGDKVNVGRRVAIGVATCIGTVAIMCIVFYFWLRRNKYKYAPSSFVASYADPRRKNTDNRDVEAFMREHGPLTLQKYSYTDIKRMTDSFRDKLGQGGYASVYKGKQADGRLVAVKVLNFSHGYDGAEFINEVASIGRTSHVNVVTLLGFCLEGNQRALIYDFMPNGSLEKFLNNESNLKVNEHLQLGWEKLHQIAIGVARGLEYLHRGCNTRIVHFDIKPHNILLDQEFCPKMTRKESFLSMSMARGTIGYIAPEVFCRQFGGVSHKSDVYSYGMLVLEMVGARTKDEAETEISSEKYFPQWIYRRLEVDLEFELQQGGVLGEEFEIVRKMTVVGLWCTQTNPGERPSISKVIEMLEGPVEALTIPPKPFLSSAVPRSLPSYSSSTTSLT